MDYTVTFKNKHTNKIVKGIMTSNVELSENAFFEKLKKVLFNGFVLSINGYTIDDSYKVLKVNKVN